jgi:hypothetical protein
LAFWYFCRLVRLRLQHQLVPQLVRQLTLPHLLNSLWPLAKRLVTRMQVTDSFLLRHQVTPFRANAQFLHVYIHAQIADAARCKTPEYALQFLKHQLLCAVA